MKQIRTLNIWVVAALMQAVGISAGIAELACPSPTTVPCSGNPDNLNVCGNANCDTSGVDWSRCNKKPIYSGPCATTDWAAVAGQNYQCYYSCDCLACTTYWRCAAGYYGAPTSCFGLGCNSMTPTCLGCATNTSHSGATSVLSDNSAITRCFLPTGTTGSGTDGIYEYVSACYYAN
ncbi:MAG: hypothetical protein LBD50_02595 [Rickettsiales bacterium]|nr:hypothetical protein [Rickettsiales bacterium]